MPAECVRRTGGAAASIKAQRAKVEAIPITPRTKAMGFARVQPMKFVVTVMPRESGASSAARPSRFKRRSLEYWMPRIRG